MRRLVALLIAIAVALGGLLVATRGGGDDAGSRGLDDVTVSGGSDAKPTARFEQPFPASESGRRLLREGEGEVVDEEALVTFDYVALDGRDGTELEATYGDRPVTVDLGEGRLLPALADGLVGAPVGSRVLVAIPPDAAPTAGGQGGAPGAVLFVIDVRGIRHPLERAEGTPVAPVAGLPSVTLADDGRPAITVPATPPPPDLVVQPLIAGGGPVVEAGQTLVAHYTGIVWGGQQFDSSWDRGAPATFAIGSGGVIAGWDEGLVGQPLGSQVLLVVPSAKGYPEGNESAGIAPGDTIVFVVDLLDAF